MHQITIVEGEQYLAEHMRDYLEGVQRMMIPCAKYQIISQERWNPFEGRQERTMYFFTPIDNATLAQPSLFSSQVFGFV